MKTITVRQPWAWLIVNGYKTVENRTWSTDYRGPLAIHAGHKVEQRVLRAVRQVAEANGTPLSASDEAEMRIVGALVGVVDLVDCTTTVTESEDLQWWEPDMIGWLLRNPRPLAAPLPMPGRLGLFDVPDFVIPD